MTALWSWQGLTLAAALLGVAGVCAWAYLDGRRRAQLPPEWDPPTDKHIWDWLRVCRRADKRQQRGGGRRR